MPFRKGVVKDPEEQNWRFQRRALNRAVFVKRERTGAQLAGSRVNKERNTIQRMKRVDEESGRMEGSIDETPGSIHSGKREV